MSRQEPFPIAKFFFKPLVSRQQYGNVGENVRRAVKFPALSMFQSLWM
jgi:hypothetical protein